jgi:hypothetical protein
MPGNADPGQRVRLLLRNYGRTYAQEAGIRLVGRARCTSCSCSSPCCAPGPRPAGASTLLREVREVWPPVVPCTDDRMTDGAAGCDDPAALLADSGRPARLAASPVRLSLTRNPSLNTTES